MIHLTHPKVSSLCSHRSSARGLASQLQSSGSGTPGESQGYVDSSRVASPGAGVQAAERIMRDRVDGGESRRPLGSPDEAGLGKFYFEEKK